MIPIKEKKTSNPVSLDSESEDEELSFTSRNINYIDQRRKLGETFGTKKEGHNNQKTLIRLINCII